MKVEVFKSFVYSIKQILFDDHYSSEELKEILKVINNSQITVLNQDLFLFYLRKFVYNFKVDELDKKAFKEIFYPTKSSKEIEDFIYHFKELFFDIKSSKYNLKNFANLLGIELEDEDNGKFGEYVDLGLPSGLLWASCNLGAKNILDVGKYYSWGDTQGYTLEEVLNLAKEGTELFNEDLSNYVHASYNETTSLYEYDNYPADQLEKNDDAISLEKGKNWRIPSVDEIRELVANTELIDDLNSLTNFEKDFYENERGIIFVSKNNGNKIIFPFTSYIKDGSLRENYNHVLFWSRSINEENEGQSWLFNSNYATDSPETNLVVPKYRYRGVPLRGVLSKDKN